MTNPITPNDIRDLLSRLCNEIDTHVVTVAQALADTMDYLEGAADEIDRLTSERDALRKTLDSDLPGDAGYGHCNWCEKSTVKLFDGKVWVCKECSIIQPAKPRTPPSAPSAVPAATTLHERCSTCNGKGTLLCENCDGEGYMRNDWGDLKECPRCDGTGNRECKSCKGTGAVEYTLPQPAKPAPARAADDAAKAAPKLTAKQIDVLNYLSRCKNGEDRYTQLSHGIKSMIGKLESRGFVQRAIDWSFNDHPYTKGGVVVRITDAGRAALKASER